MSTSRTLRTAIDQYIQHQKEAGQKPSTLGTCQRSLQLLVDEMGEDKDIARILAVHVAQFFKSDSATLQDGKDGPRPRAEASILQIRRIVRTALVWWHEQGWIANIPLPKEDKRFLEPRKPRKASGEAPAETAETRETADPTNPTADATTVAAE